MLALAAASGAARADGAGERAAKEAPGASLRRALRTATVLLAARAAQAMSTEAPPGKMPMAVFVGPVATAPGVDASATGATEAAYGAANVRYYLAQAATMREMVVDFAVMAVEGESGDAVFAVRAGSKRRGRGSPATTPPTEDVERELARKAGADYLIEASLQTVLSDSDSGEASGIGKRESRTPTEVHLALHLVDAHDGTAVCASDVALPDVSAAATDAKSDRKKG